MDIKNIDKKLKCFCVGSATEKNDRSVGFQNVFVAEGNVSNLNELILQKFKTSDVKLIYISVEIISSDLDK